MARDRFLDAVRCDRCGKRLDGGKVEADNGDVICLKCADKASVWATYNLTSIAWLNEVKRANKGVINASIH